MSASDPKRTRTKAFGTGGNSGGTSQSLEGIFDQYGNLRIAVKWDSGAVAVYAGGINAEGRFAGVVKDESNPGNAVSWHQVWHDGRDIPVTCLAEATPPLPEAPASPSVSEVDEFGVPNNGVGEILAPAPAPSPASPPAGSKTATVIADVDVYKAAGGAGEAIGVLYSNNKSTKVSLVAPCQDNCVMLRATLYQLEKAGSTAGPCPTFSLCSSKIST